MMPNLFLRATKTGVLERLRLIENLRNFGGIDSTSEDWHTMGR
jgi:hypothetical protein